MGRQAGVAAVEVEVVCSDPAEHRRRVEERQPDIAGLRLPDWSAVVGRDYRPWTRDRLVLDTARRGAAENVEALFHRLARGSVE